MKPTQIVQIAFQHQSTPRIPRGELWLGTELFRKCNLEDNLEGHIELVRRLGHDLICLPISNSISIHQTLGYRYFTTNELEEAELSTDLFLIAILDGPFQTLTEKYGLMKLFTGWMRERGKIMEQYDLERRRIDDLLAQVLEVPVDAVVVAEDLAGEQGPLMSPNDVQEYFSPFYTQTISKIHKKKAYALLHSCGKITTLLPQIVSCGFDGLAAIQHRANDLVSIKQEYGSRLTIMAGIDADLLEKKENSDTSLEPFLRLLRSLSAGGGFILSSCTGLYSENHFKRIQELYPIVDTSFGCRIP